MTATPHEPEQQPTDTGAAPAPVPAQSAPTPAPPASSAPAVDGLDPKIGGLLAYLLFGWIGGLIMLLTQKHPEVRFHGAQSVLVSIALLAVGLGLGVLSAIFGFVPGLGFVAAILSFLVSVGLSIGGFALWIVLCIKGYNLEHFKLPLVGDIAERWAGYDAAAQG